MVHTRALALTSAFDERRVTRSIKRANPLLSVVHKPLVPKRTITSMFRKSAPPPPVFDDAEFDEYVDKYVDEAEADLEGIVTDELDKWVPTQPVATQEEDKEIILPLSPPQTPSPRIKVTVDDLEEKDLDRHCASLLYSDQHLAKFDCDHSRHMFMLRLVRFPGLSTKRLGQILSDTLAYSKSATTYGSLFKTLLEGYRLAKEDDSTYHDIMAAMFNHRDENTPDVWLYFTEALEDNLSLARIPYLRIVVPLAELIAKSKIETDERASVISALRARLYGASVDDPVNPLASAIRILEA